MTYLRRILAAVCVLFLLTLSFSACEKEEFHISDSDSVILLDTWVDPEGEPQGCTPDANCGG